MADFAKQQKIRIDAAIAQRATEVGALLNSADSSNSQRGGGKNSSSRRKHLGTITLDDLPPDKREGYPAASFWGVPVSCTLLVRWQAQLS